MKNLLLSFKTNLKKTPLLKIKRAWNENFSQPTIISPWIYPNDDKLQKVLLVCVESSFNQKIPNANYYTPLNFAQGWSESSGPVKFIHVKNLFKEIDNYNNPAIFICQHNYRHFSFSEARKLRGKNVFAWVAPHPRALKDYELLNPLLPEHETNLYLDGYAKLIVSEPKFVWSSVGKAANRFYDDWTNDGFIFHRIFPGANSSIYYPDYSEMYKKIKIAYVGGYWEEKSISLNRYFRPIENIFTPFGYNVWPYKNYAGKLTESEERRLYSSAGLIPLLHGPAGWSIAEITERYLKAPACGAFCIGDENPALREIFSEDEMLQATSSDHFQYLVNEFIAGKIDIEYWKKASYSAILDRHLVKHRGFQILKALEI